MTEEMGNHPDEGHDIEFAAYVDWKAEARADAETAMMVYRFLEEVDTNSPSVLMWRIGGKLVRTQKECLNIICRAIRELKD